MRIGIDLDGCVYNFTQSFIDYLTRPGAYYDASTLVWPDRWNTWECWGMSQRTWLDHFKKGVERGHIFRTGEPIKGSVEALNTLKEQGHTLHIVTHRDIHPRAIQSTWEWLAEHKVPYDTITFAKDKTCQRVDVFIDDNLDNYAALNDAGVCAVLFDQPWNSGPNAELYALDGERRVTSWGEFVGFVRQHKAHMDMAADKEQAFADSVADKYGFPRGMVNGKPRGNNVAEYVDPNTGGIKGVKPEQVSMVPVAALQALSRIYTMGAEKYGRANYLKGYPWSLSYDALQRHLMEWWSGNETDDESGESHLMHAAWHCFTLFMFRKYGLGTDDRWSPPETPAAKEIKGLVDAVIQRSCEKALDELFQFKPKPQGGFTDADLKTHKQQLADLKRVDL